MADGLRRRPIKHGVLPTSDPDLPDELWRKWLLPEMEHRSYDAEGYGPDRYKDGSLVEHVRPEIDVVDRVARAIFDAENGIDGDQIGEMLYDGLPIEGSRAELVARVMAICRMAARAAIEEHTAALVEGGYKIVRREPGLAE